MTFLDANPVRYGVLLYLHQHGPTATTQLQAALPEVGRSTLLRHLNALERAGYIVASIPVHERPITTTVVTWRLDQTAVDAALRTIAAELGSPQAFS